MPEGPELHLSAKLVSAVGKRMTFGGPIIKSKVSTKNPDIDWDCEKYTVNGVSRGKEMKVLLTDVTKKKGKNDSIGSTMSILFRFGMSGSFKVTSVKDLPKHAHLQFYSSDKKEVLSFVDYRRFGHWFINQDWEPDRGPCFITEYSLFREHVAKSIVKRVFDGPICEVLLDQRYFNGVGNYLRAEALHRCGIRPFDSARNVLTPLLLAEKEADGKPQGKKVKTENEEKKAEDDVLFMLHKLAHEVVGIGSESGYFYEASSKEEKTTGAFFEWLQCYMQDGMKTVKDNRRRTVWYAGEPGSCAKVSDITRELLEKEKKDADDDETKSKVKKKTKTKIKKEALADDEEKPPLKKKIGTSKQKKKKEIDSEETKTNVKKETKPKIKKEALPEDEEKPSLKKKVSTSKQSRKGVKVVSAKYARKELGGEVEGAPRKRARRGGSDTVTFT